MLIVEAKKIAENLISEDKLLLALSKLEVYCRERLFVKGKVETITVIVDLGGVNISDYQKISSIFCSFLGPRNYILSHFHQVFVLNRSLLLGLRFFFENSIFGEKYPFKIKYLQTSNLESLHKTVYIGQLEKKFQGKNQNLENGFWPPKMPNNIVDSVLVPENLISAHSYIRDIAKHNRSI